MIGKAAVAQTSLRAEILHFGVQGFWILFEN